MAKRKHPRSPTLEEVLEGARRAAERIKSWPQWKQDLTWNPSERPGEHRS